MLKFKPGMWLQDRISKDLFEVERVVAVSWTAEGAGLFRNLGRHYQPLPYQVGDVVTWGNQGDSFQIVSMTTDYVNFVGWRALHAALQKNFKLVKPGPLSVAAVEEPPKPVVEEKEPLPATQPNPYTWGIPRKKADPTHEFRKVNGMWQCGLSATHANDDRHVLLDKLTNYPQGS